MMVQYVCEYCGAVYYDETCCRVHENAHAERMAAVKVMLFRDGDGLWQFHFHGMTAVPRAAGCVVMDARDMSWSVVLPFPAGGMENAVKEAEARLKAAALEWLEAQNGKVAGLETGWGHAVSIPDRGESD